MHTTTTPPLSDENLTEYRLQFHGNTTEYFKIWLSNILLSIITLGIFSAWAKVRNKRYFYGNTTLGEFNFNYHAKPISILISRLIVITVVIGGAIVAGEDILRSAAHSTLLYLLLPWAIVRSFSFNARNSSYRGIRFHFNRTYTKIYLIFVPFIIGILATNIIIVLSSREEHNLNWATETFIFLPVLLFWILFIFLLPLLWRAYYRFKTDNHAWGNAPFHYDAPLLKRFILPLFYSFLSFIPLIVVFELFDDIDNIDILPYLFIFSFLFVYLSFIFLVTYLFRLHWQSVRILGGYVQCDFSTADYFFKIIVVNFFAAFLSLGLLRPWAKVRKARFLANNIRLFIPVATMDSILKSRGDDESALGEEFDTIEGFDFDVGLI